MRYLSLFSGIEAATQAFHHHGWEPAAFAEIEAFPAAVLKHHYPNVPNLGDVTKHKDWKDIGPVDLICGGSPCQSFSVAGLRKGMDDPRGNLTLTYLSIVDQYRPKWIIYENVPGLLSSNRGRDFGSMLGGMAELGYGWAYRVLDAQHVRTRRFPHAVPQRRRRVFVIGYLGDWRRAAAVLFDRESLSGHPAPRREAGQGIAVSPSLRAQSQSSHRLDSEAFVPVSNSGDVGYCLTASAQGSLDAETETMVAVPSAYGLSTQQEPKWAENVSPTLARPSISGGGQVTAVAFRIAGDGNAYEEGSIAAPLTTGTDRSASAVVQPFTIMERGRGAMDVGAIALPWAVRRLTPVECERLMGFPENFTRIPYRGKPADKCPDGPRYKAIGNSWAVNCADWIAERIEQVDAWPTPTLHNAGSPRQCAGASGGRIE